MSEAPAFIISGRVPPNGLGLARTPLRLKYLPCEIEILAVRPGQLDDLDPFLGVVVALVVLALLDAEHVELVLVPADHEVEAEAALADVVGGDESPWRR